MNKIRRKKGDDEITRLTRENRELRALNRSLSKRIKKLGRNFDVSFEEEEQPINFKKECCPDCGKGFLNEARVANRLFKSCTLCDFRTRAIKIS